MEKQIISKNSNNIHFGLKDVQFYTDHDTFPYQDWWNKNSQDLDIKNRKAGFYKPFYVNRYDSGLNYPIGNSSLCFQYPCSTTFPCNKKDCNVYQSS